MTKTTFMRMLALGLVVFAFGCPRGWESQEPPVHLILNMDTQEKGKAYRIDSTGLFENGRMMQPPVEGTLSREEGVSDPLLHLGLDADEQPTKEFPDRYEKDGELLASVIERGKGRYDIYCAPCHGVGGDGQGPVAMPALDGGKRLLIPPANFHDERLKNMVVGQFYSAIINGVNNGNMYSYAAQIPVDDRWAIVAHIRTLQREKDASVEYEGGEGPVVVAEATEASAEHGAQLYVAKACIGCHSLDGSRLVGPTFKGLIGRTGKTNVGEVVADKAYIVESIKNPAAKLVEGYPPAMPQLPLNDVEVESLYLYIESIQ